MDKNDIPLGNAKNHGYCNLYFWRRGHWKTQQAVIDAFEAYKRGDVVISNIWLSFPHIRFRNSSELVPILRELSEYCNEVKMPSEAPVQMLHEYWVKRKKNTTQQFFLLFDEIWKHLNRRNWNSNFKEDFLRDMLTEPRKYNLTIVGITQAWDRVDIEFLQACEDWFLFSKSWKWIFEQYNCTRFWVLNWQFNIESPKVIERTRHFIFFWKPLTNYRSMYWTGELVGDWKFQGDIPHLFEKGDIYSQKEPKDSPFSSFPLINPAPENRSEAEPAQLVEPKGEEYGGLGASPKVSRKSKKKSKPTATP